jgi:hypothetical protein
MLLQTTQTTPAEKAQLFQASDNLTPETREAIKAEALQKWQEHMEIIGIDCPIDRQIGRPSNKQFDWAVNNWHYFIGSAHPEFCADDIKLFCSSIQSKNFRFWIDNRSATTCHIRGTTDRRLETAIAAKIAEMKADIAATIKAEKTIAQLSPAELNRKIGRGL